MARRHVKLAALSGLALVLTLYCFIASVSAGALWGLAGVAGAAVTIGLFLTAWWSRP